MVQSIGGTHIHDFLLQIDSVSIGKMMFIASFGIPVKFHIGLRLSVIFTDAVDYDMHMNIATAIMTVSVSTNECLVSGKIFFGIFHAKLLCQFSSQSMFVPVLDDILIEKTDSSLMKLKYKFDKAIQLALVSDNTSAKKIADEVMAELEKEDLYTEDEVYSQDVIAMMYEMYYNFDPDVKWLEKALHVREKMNIKKFTEAGKVKYYSDIAYTYWKMGNYEVAEQDFCTSLEYAKTAFAQIYLLDCLVEQKKIKNLKEYLESVEFENMGADSIDFLIIVGNAAIQLNDNDSIELIKRYIEETNIEVPYYKFYLKELELELEKKSGKIMRLLNKLSPLKKYLILQPQLNGIGINVEKILEDLKK